MSRFLSARYSGLTPYVPGEQPRGMAYVKLNTNESPFPPAPGVMEAINEAAVRELNLYSDPTARSLEDAIAENFSLAPDQVIAGNGSDEILAFCFQAFCDAERRPCFPDITYGFYRVFAALYGLTSQIMPLDESFAIRPADYAGMGGVFFLANPNAPTGLYLPLKRVEEIVREDEDRLVIVDEAYIDFGGQSAASLINRYANLLVVQTFSKSRNLAGARIGYALGQKSLIDDLRKMKYSFNPYSLNRLSLLAGAAAMRDTEYFAACTQAIQKTRAWVTEQLLRRGFTVLDSMANFILAKPPMLTGLAYYERLKQKGVLVRHFSSPRVGAFVRITIGAEAQMTALLKATDSILEEI